VYKVLSAESCSGGDTQPAGAAAVNQTLPSKSLHPPSLLYPVVNKEVEHSSQGEQEKPVLTSLNVNNLGKAAVLHPALFWGWGLAKLSLPIIGHSCAYVKFS
jgi:hypothetical protein